jgi:hypothetical protein
MLQLLSPIGLVSSGRQEDEREECPLSKSQEGLVRQADENGVKIRETEKAIEKLPQLQEQARPVDSKLREDQGSPTRCRKEAVAAAGIILEELLDEIHAFSELQGKLCGTVLPNYNINLSEKVPPDRSEELEKAYENIQTLKLEISRLQSPHFKKPQNTQEICDRSNIETVPPEKFRIARSTKKRGADRKKEKTKLELIGKNRELWRNMESMRKMFKKKKLLRGTVPKENKERKKSELQQPKVSRNENLKVEKVSALESVPKVMENVLFDSKKNQWICLCLSTSIKPKIQNCATNPKIQTREKIQILEKSSENKISSIFALWKEKEQTSFEIRKSPTNEPRRRFCAANQKTCVGLREKSPGGPS